MSAISIGRLILFVGGVYRTHTSHSAISHAVDIYDTRTGRWSTSSFPGASVVGQPVTLGTKALFLNQGGRSLSVFDAATRAWSIVPLSAYYANPVFVTVDGQGLLAEGRHADLLSPAPVPAPIARAPGDASALSQPPRSFAWSASRGATSYDVYIDNELAATVRSTQWKPDFPITAGEHHWWVVAHLYGGTLAGQPAGFTVSGPHFDGQIDHLRLPSIIRPGATGSAIVSVDAADVAADSIVVGVYASTHRGFGSRSILLGSVSVLRDPRLPRTKMRLQIPLTLPKSIPIHALYHAVLTITTSKVTTPVSSTRSSFFVTRFGTRATRSL